MSSVNCKRKVTWCQSCVLPDTRPNLVINENGICNACASHKIKLDINWSKREKLFREVVAHAKAKSKGYDCLIPVSGGKDSTWQVIKCLEYGLKPLAVTWKTPGRTEIGQKNLDNLVALGVDHIDYQINPSVEKRFVLAAFKKYGSTAIPMHLAIFNIPMSLAIRFDIPLIVWGENSAFEYGGREEETRGFELTPEWLIRHGVSHGTTALDWVSSELSKSDLIPYFGPAPEQVKKSKLSAIFLGYYFNWDPEVTKTVAASRGFVADQGGARTGFYNYADIDDDFISIHHWLKWYKFGFTRLFDNLSLEIRNRRITRAEAIEIISNTGDQTPEADIHKLCTFMNITYEEFMQISEKFRNKNIWRKDSGVWMLPNFLIPNWKWS